MANPTQGEFPEVGPAYPDGSVYRYVYGGEGAWPSTGIEPGTVRISKTGKLVFPKDLKAYQNPEDVPEKELRELGVAITAAICFPVGA